MFLFIHSGIFLGWVFLFIHSGICIGWVLLFIHSNACLGRGLNIFCPSKKLAQFTVLKGFKISHE